MVGSGFDAGGAVRRRAMRHERVPGSRGIGSALVPVFALAFAVSVAGCSGSSEPDKTFTPTATEKYVPPTPTGGADVSSSAGSSPSAGEYQPATETSPARNVPVPKYPKAARANTEEGQKAFIEYWFKTYNYAFETGDTKPMTAVSDRECEFCQQAAGKATEIVLTNKTWRTSGGAQPNLMTAKHRGVAEETQVWDVSVLDARIEFWDSKGKSDKYKTSAETKSLGRFWLEYENSAWILRASAVVEDEE